MAHSFGPYDQLEIPKSQFSGILQTVCPGSVDHGSKTKELIAHQYVLVILVKLAYFFIKIIVNLGEMREKWRETEREREREGDQGWLLRT